MGGGGAAPAPASKATSRKDCCGVEGEGLVGVLVWTVAFTSQGFKVSS